jgi:hypothetical protein
VKHLEKSIKLINEKFESSSNKTPQYLKAHKTFKNEFKKMMNPICNNIEISKPNHFDITGFFELKNNKIYYFSIGDLRWSGEIMLFRTAKDFKDYSGGINQYYPISQLNEFDKFIMR